MFESLKESINEYVQATNEVSNMLCPFNEDDIEDEYMEGEGYDYDNIDPELSKIIDQIPEYVGGDELTDKDLELADNEIDPTVSELVESTLFLV